MIFRTALTISLAAAVLAACATSPTGRKQLILLPESQMSALGAQAFAEMRRAQPTEKSPAMNIDNKRPTTIPKLAHGNSGLPDDVVVTSLSQRFTFSFGDFITAFLLFENVSG